MPPAGLSALRGTGSPGIGEPGAASTAGRPLGRHGSGRRAQGWRPCGLPPGPEPSAGTAAQRGLGAARTASTGTRLGPLFRRKRRSRKKRGAVPSPLEASPLSCEVRRGSSEDGGSGCRRRPPAPSPQPARARPHRPRTPGRPLRLPGAGCVTSSAPRRPLSGAGRAVVLTTRRRRRGPGAGAARGRRSWAGRPALGSASGPCGRPRGNARALPFGGPLGRRLPGPGAHRGRWPSRGPGGGAGRRRGPGNLSRGEGRCLRAGEDPAPPPAGARRVPRCS